jgi:cobalt-precorrin 5A hydrolase
MSGHVVVVGVSRAGAVLAQRVAAALPGAEAHVLAQWAPLAPDAQSIAAPLSTALPRLFRDPSVQGMVVVLAVGATVRLLAPWLRGKELDPAVVALDDSGRFAIALLSGHRGGANDLARQVAAAIGACPVVTTASDCAGPFAVDLLGAEEGWKIEASPEALRRAAAAVVNREPVGIYQDVGSHAWRRDELPETIRQVAAIDQTSVDNLAALLVVSDRVLTLPPSPPWHMIYRPPTLVAGIGCSRGATAEDVVLTIEMALEKGGLARGSLAKLATIDRRLDEPGLVACGQRLGLPLVGFTAEELAAVQSLPTPSAVVGMAVGTPGVSEPAALLASGAAELLVPKVKTARATAAIARMSGTQRDDVAAYTPPTGMEVRIPVNPGSTGRADEAGRPPTGAEEEIAMTWDVTR